MLCVQVHIQLKESYTHKKKIDSWASSGGQDKAGGLRVYRALQTHVLCVVLDDESLKRVNENLFSFFAVKKFR